MEYRPYYLGREWVRAGHRVCIAAASYSHVRAVQPTAGATAIRSPVTENIDGVGYRWFPTARYRGNGVLRVRNVFGFLRGVWSDARRIVSEEGPHVVIASSTYPFDIWVARRLASMSGARVIFELHDLWPLSPVELGGMSRWHPFVLLCALAERAAYCESDAVVSMLPKVGEYVEARGFAVRQLHLVSNGVSEEDWARKGQEVGGELGEHLHRERALGNCVVGYAGAHGVPNALDTLLDAAKLLAGDPIRIVLVGDGHEKVRLQRRVVKEGLVNVKMFAPVSRPQVRSLLESFDIAYLGLKKEPLFRYGVSPNKLMDYMMAAKPIVYAVESGNDPVGDAGCGLTVGADSPEEVAAGIRRLARASAADRLAMGMKGRSYVQEHHSYPVLAKKFLSVMEALL